MRILNHFFTIIYHRIEVDGVFGIFKKIITVLIRKSVDFFVNIYFSAAPKKFFIFNGKQYSYFRHRYNRTWENERIVEVPLICEFIKQYAPEDILEIGNVTRNYYPSFNHDVLDKYEKGAHIINNDAEFFKPSHKYKFIVTVSTMEHIGWDEIPRDPEKLLRAFSNIVKNCLAERGIFLMTVPLGYNSSLDAFLDAGRFDLTEKFFLHRVSKENRWVQSRYSEVRGAKFNYPFHNANVIMLGIMKKK